MGERVYTYNEIEQAIRGAVRSANGDPIKLWKDSAKFIANKLDLKVKVEPEFPETVRWDNKHFVITDSEGQVLVDILMDMCPLRGAEGLERARMYGPEFAYRWNLASRIKKVVTDYVLSSSFDIPHKPTRAESVINLIAHWITKI